MEPQDASGCSLVTGECDARREQRLCMEQIGWIGTYFTVSIVPALTSDQARSGLEDRR
jgi:hypothetical protein